MTAEALADLDAALAEWVAALLGSGATQRHEADPEAVPPSSDALARLVGCALPEGGRVENFGPLPRDPAMAASRTRLGVFALGNGRR